VGLLWARADKNKESASFEYDPAWLENPVRFSLEPALQLGPGPFHAADDFPMFGAGPLGPVAHAAHGAAARGS